MKKIIIFIFLLTESITISGRDSQKTIKISDDLELIKVTDNAYIHLSYDTISGYGRVASNGLILIDGSRAFLFDTPVSEKNTKLLLDYLSDVMKVDVKGFVPNHWHSDCIGGLVYLQKQSIESYASLKTIEITKDKGLPVPDHGFKDSLLLRLNNKTIECYYPGPAHSMDNIVVWIASEKILFAGCMCKSISSSDLGNIVDGDSLEYLNTIEKVITRFHNAVIVIPGHGEAGGPELLYHTRDLAIKQRK
jgi:metallo-beta-lactamase class B